MLEHTPKIEVDTDLPPTTDAAGRFIAIGTAVRSFCDPEVLDLEGDRAYYVEGTVEGVCHLSADDPSYDDPRYAIRIARWMRGGKWSQSVTDSIVFVPLNGRPSTMGGYTRGVYVLPVPADELPTEAQLQEATEASQLWVYAMGSYYGASFVRIKRSGAFEVEYTSGAGKTRKKTVRGAELAGARPGLVLGDRPAHRRGADANKAKAHLRRQLAGGAR
jgi:hypothetical protein